MSLQGCRIASSVTGQAYSKVQLDGDAAPGCTNERRQLPDSKLELSFRQLRAIEFVAQEAHTTPAHYSRRVHLVHYLFDFLRGHFQHHLTRYR